MTYAGLGIASLSLFMQTHAASLTDIVNDTASGAIATAGTVADGPAGTIVYTIMGINILITIIGLIYMLKRG